MSDANEHSLLTSPRLGAFAFCFWFAIHSGEGAVCARRSCSKKGRSPTFTLACLGSGAANPILENENFWIPTSTAYPILEGEDFVCLLPPITHFFRMRNFG